MKTRQSTSFVTCTLAILAISVWTLSAAAPVPGPANAIVDAGKTFAPINPNLYGMFIEHAGSLVYAGMWAEMIGDRKFFNVISIQDTLTPHLHSLKNSAAFVAHRVPGFPLDRPHPSPWTRNMLTPATTRTQSP